MTKKQKSAGRSSGGVGHLLKMSPLARVLTGDAVSLPECPPPSLDGLSVVVPPPVPLTPDDLALRLRQKARELGPKRDRAAGEALAMGDDVLIDTVGYSAGKLVPFSARFAVWLELAPMVSLPGFSEALAQGTVGGSQQLNLTLPADFPVERLRGAPARFLVDLKAAREVKAAPLDSADLLAQLGVPNLDAAMDQVRRELEQEQQDALVVAARNLVLDEVARRSDPQVPRSLVDEEIRRRWGEVEGQALVERNYDVAEQEEAQQAWLDDPATRADCERRLRVGLALKAMAAAQQLSLTPQKLERLVAEYVAEFGLSADDVAQGLRESKELTKKITDLGWHLLCVDHVMSKATVKFAGG